MTAYYNEHDRFAAAWLRELIKDGLIAPGEVDERSIEDVTPNDLRPFRQCHFFAGIGVWSLAARRAGIPDSAPLWTGSCPCQPFSTAGKGEGFDDERHLWPAFHYLIEQCRPALVVGEQVAGADGDAWFDLVSADLDATGYAFGAAETCAAGFGAPHKRSRNYWVGHSLGARLEGFGGHVLDGHQPGWIGTGSPGSAAAHGTALQLAHVSGRGRGILGGEMGQGSVRHPERGDDAPDRLGHAEDGDGRRGERGAQEGTGPDEQWRLGPAGGNPARELAHANGESERGRRGDEGGPARRGEDQERGQHGQRHGAVYDRGRTTRLDRPGPVNGLWGDADWIFCRDEKWRAIEPTPLSMADAGTIRGVLAGGGGAGEAFTFPLCEKGTFRNRTGLLKGAGNAVNIGQAQGFLEAVMKVLG